MADWSYGPDSLKLGTFGGRGFWLMSDCTSWNTNDLIERRIEDGTAIAKLRPYFYKDTVCNISPISIDLEPTVFNFQMNYYYVNYDLTWVNVNSDVQFRNDPRIGGTPYAGLQHMDNVQFLNVANLPCLSCERIQVGLAGYKDVLPGMYKIQVMKEDYDKENQVCRVSITPYSNIYEKWTLDHDYVEKSTKHAYSTLRSPYVNTEGVIVSFADGNWNANIIHGLRVQLSTDIDIYDSFVIAVGCEFVNRRAVENDNGTYEGEENHFLPLVSPGIEPQIPSLGMFFAGTAAAETSWAGPDVPRWTVFNVSGKFLTDVQFHIFPLVRLEQNQELKPFSQFYMGCNSMTQLPQSKNHYIVSFSNVSNGKADFSCSYSVSTTVREIDPETYQTVRTLSNGKGLKCDNATIYCWDSGGVYFVLSSEISNGDKAKVWVKKGCEHLGLRKKDVCFNDFPNGVYDVINGALQANHFEFGPLDYQIGLWSAIEGSVFNFNNVDVIDHSEEDETVGLIAPAHGLLKGQSIRIKNTINYNGDFILEESTTSSEIRIKADYVEETLSGATYQVIYPGDNWLPESYHTGIMAPQGHKYVLQVQHYNLSAAGGGYITSTEWYDHYFRLTWVGAYRGITYQEGLALMAENPFEAALVVTCSDPRYFKAVPVTWLYNPDITGYYLYSDNIMSNSLRIMQQVGEPNEPVQMRTMLNVADIDPSLVVRVNQVPSEVAAIYEELGITTEEPE